MQFKRLVMTSVCALALLKAVAVQAADDVYVDLSVLNNLQPGDSLFVETQPLFPVVKKTPVKKAVKKKTTRKQVISKAKAAKVEPRESVSEKPIVILPQAPEISQPLAEEKNGSKSQITLSDAKTTEREEIARVDGSDLSNSTETQAAPVLPVNSGVLVPVSRTAIEAAPKTDETIEQKPSENSLSLISVAPAETETKPLAEPLNNPKSIEAEAPDAVASKGEAAIPEVSDNKVIEPLIPATSEASKAAPYQIFFADNSFEVSDENSGKIISLIKSFEDPHKHKIAIYAFNYDNGENSFKKKKLSLDRATEIRSLLLNNGYKNFSIKVINVTDNPEKRNLVEIEEIK